MELEEFKNISINLIESSKAAYLTTIDNDGFPITRAMFNLRNKEQFPEFIETYKEQENKFTIFISTNTSSSKLTHIKKNPKISVYYCDPDDFKGATYKLDYPKTAVLILPSGKVICTGAINMEEVEKSIRRLTEKIMKIGINVNTNPTIETQNIVASTDIKKELDLSFISKSLLLKNVNYEPDQFPGLIYIMDEIGVIVLVFSSGKIISTGAKSFEDASKAIEMMKEKLSSFGIL